MTIFIDVHRQEYGVEPICALLPIAPSTYYAKKSRPPSERSLRDGRLQIEIIRVYEENHAVCGSDDGPFAHGWRALTGMSGPHV
jgi:putative transposase